MLFKCANLLRRSAPSFRWFSISFNQLNIQQDLSQDRIRTFANHTRRRFIQYSPGSFIFSRAMSSSEIRNIDISEYLKFKEDNNTVIIDVREKSEIAETGIIPGGVNIPLGEVADALQKDDTTFEKTYQRAKPSDKDRIIFSCRSGKRSMMAAQTAQKLGYDNVLNLAGGWLAWEEYSKK